MILVQHTQIGNESKKWEDTPALKLHKMKVKYFNKLHNDDIEDATTFTVCFDL